MNTSKHILLYTDDPGIYGVGQYNHSILCGLIELGFKVTCVQSRASNSLIRHRNQLGVEQLWLDFDTSQDFGRTLTNLADARNIFTSANPDIIIFSNCCPLSNFAAKQVAIDHKIPYIVVEHFVASYLAERFSLHLNELSKHYGLAHAVITVSLENLTLLKQLFKLDNAKGQVIYNGRPAHYFAPSQSLVCDRLRQEFNIPLNAVVCFTASRLEAVKGYQYQLEAIRQLKGSSVWPQLYFIWAGAGTLEAQLKEAVKQVGVTEQVKLIGERQDISDWLDVADIFVFPSELEGMPLAVMEAMAKGLPVIASAVSGIPEELGATGKLLLDPKVDPQATITELVTTIQDWSINPELRQSIGKACKRRAEEIFREEQMIKETVEVIERALLPVGDYVSPELSIIQPDRCFPNMIVGDTSVSRWPYLRREVPHNWYVDKRQPTVGFLNRDEAHILYNTALKFKGKKALEIGCWLGWSACHLALAGVELDVIDPLLGRPEFYESVSNSLMAASVLDLVNLIPGYSPQNVEELAAQLQRKWSLIFIDGNHDAPGPINDTIISEKFAEADALILFHDLTSPDVAQGLDYLKQRGWNTMVYQTMQIMGVAWRGNVEPVQHQPDPKVYWYLPAHLQDYSVSGMSSNQTVDEVVISQQVQEMLQQALALLNSSKPVEAVRIAEKAASIGINVPGMHYTRSICLCSVGRYQEALEAAKAELAINPTHPQAQAQVEGLTRGLSKTEITIPTHQRTWNTALPRETMLSIQLASHNYSYRGVPMIKNPFDFALYPLLIWNLKPRTIIEIGSKNGGSALWFGDILNNFGVDGHIYSVDIIKVNSVRHPRVTFIEGNGRELQEIFTPDFLNSLPHPMLVIEDADHAYETSNHVLEFFHPYIRAGEYIVIEDGIISDLSQDSSYNSGPHKALKEFLLAHQGEYEIDGNYCDFFGYNLTWCTNGFLKKISTVSDGLSQLLAQISNYLDSYQKGSNNLSTLANLRQARQEIANQWLSLPVDQLESACVGKLGKLHKMLLDSGIKNEILTDIEQNFVGEIVAHISSGLEDPKIINYLLAAMLYQRADQLLLQHDVTRIPNYLLNDYLQFILYAPAYFQKIGEADRYYHYMQGCLDYLHTKILSNPESKLWQDVALFFTQHANFIPLYFNRENLKDIYAKRADIMEFTLRNQGHQIDYEFLERSVERKKIRIGILAAHFGPQTETFTTLPAYKHLNWNEFEIILYTLRSSNHRLERYCAGHADALINLPQNLPAQVKTIREGDLDILLIATNVTAVTNSITLLALHRLARVQLTCFSSPVTTGMRNIDYYISGNLTEVLQNTQQHYREQLITIDGPGYCCDYLIEPETSVKYNRKSLGIPDKSLVFISGANFYKIIPELRETWVKIIASVPKSVLVLYPFSPSWSSSYEAIPFLNSMKAIFAKYGVEKERLIVLDALPSRSDVKECLKIGDIYLDSYPYSGANSTVDPLEAGLPTIVMDGNSLRSRQAAALIREIQIPDLVTDSEESYIQLVIALATDPQLRKEKSDQIKQRMQANPRFLDSRAYSAQMGAIFQELFRKHQTNALTENLKLRETNLIIFPDWSQPEEVLYQDLASAIASLVNCPDKNQMTLLIHLGNFSEEEASLLLSEVAMNLLLEEDLDVTDGPEISFVGQLGEIQWKALLPRVQARIVLENENQEAIAALKADSIPYYGLDSFSSDINSSYRVPGQNT